LIQITSEDLYKTAFYYAVGIISSFPYYEEMHPEEITDQIIQRAVDIIGERDVQG
jgi:hypothetical protein